MDEPDHIPHAEPAGAVATRVSSDEPAPASRFGLASIPVTPYQPPALVSRQTDGLALASAICGFTAIVPFVSQVIGLVLGTAGLVRIRRRRLAGEQVSGTGWAVAGIVSSGIALAGWIGVLVAFYLVTNSLSNSAESLNQMLKPASAAG